MNEGFKGYGFRRPSFGGSMKGLFKENPVLKWLLIVNVGIWIMVAFANLFLWLYKSPGTNLLVKWLSVPADWTELIRKPWTIVTYMFLHERFWHLFFNVWMLWFGGMIFTRFLSQKQLALTYGLGGLVGALFFVLAYNLFPVFETAKYTAVAMGASASVLAILVAAATYKPDYGLNLLLFGQLNISHIWEVPCLASCMASSLGKALDNPPNPNVDSASPRWNTRHTRKSTTSLKHRVRMRNITVKRLKKNVMWMPSWTRSPRTAMPV